jgi:hypothetical protein
MVPCILTLALDTSVCVMYRLHGGCSTVAHLDGVGRREKSVALAGDLTQIIQVSS